MTYFVPSRNGEEFFNKFLSPDPDDQVRGRLVYADITCRVKNKDNWLSGSRGNEGTYYCCNNICLSD